MKLTAADLAGYGNAIKRCNRRRCDPGCLECDGSALQPDDEADYYDDPDGDEIELWSHGVDHNETRRSR